ncbi:FecR domain-containing protein [Bacteriovorax sp. PP10]|uniref:FecR domain-containing protein n=1 Tax=Bacteriovorax antarcticus TaxID=3088717 RepID=A0ABU5VZU8_9BACT|nr:FecR domain-containing protein [Bacteriovorax sp. PP10]MEA9357893.1 FecR domain-containing protein [Bacteriovorax sp. PP10]
MKLKSQLFTTLTVTFIAFNSFAAENVAKVVVMRGMVKAKLLDGTIIDVKADQSIPEGAVVQTAEKSFVKLLFIDKSQMNLGPNSQMIINAFPKKEAGIITLVKGQIRSQVTKDYMEMDDKSKSKLYIKTKTAAMGIRGTDFQVNYNPDNQNTSLITFEGKVAMAHIGKDIRENKFDQQNLERVVSSDKAVFVTQGQVSAVNSNVAERAMVPTKLGTKQIEALEGNETGIKESSETDSGKQFRNPIPPGAEGAAFSNTSPDLDKEVSKMGISVKAMPTNFSEKAAAPEGFFNNDTGEYKLPAGSIIDLNTVNIIPPPTNAVFDSNSGTYVVPETFGKIDKVTGEYKAPAGLELGADGKFTVVDADAFKKAQEPAKEDKKEEQKKEDAPKKEGDVSATTTEGTDGRAPASTAPAADIKVPVVLSGEAKVFADTHAEPVAPPSRAPASSAPPTTTLPPNVAADLAAKAAAVLEKNAAAKQTATDRGVTVPTSSKVKFIFNAQ